MLAQAGKWCLVWWSESTLLSRVPSVPSELILCIKLACAARNFLQLESGRVLAARVWEEVGDGGWRQDGQWVQGNRWMMSYSLAE